MMSVNEIHYTKAESYLFQKIFPQPLATPCFCCSKGAEEGKHSK